MHTHNQNQAIITTSASAPTMAASKEVFAFYLINGYWEEASQNPLTQFHQWAGNNITYSISSDFTVNEANGFRSAMEQWSDITNLTFQEVSTNAQLEYNEVAFLGAETYASYYIPSGDIVEAEIRLGELNTLPTAYDWDYNAPGDFGYLTAIHEIGHALGLGHGGDYNGLGADYNTDAIFTNDTLQYTVMSYFDADNGSADFDVIDHHNNYASTPLLMDIYAAQIVYGANMTTRIGDTVYGFNNNSGRDEFDFTTNLSPVVSIWDAGGIDTIDVSGYSFAQSIDLREGEFSNVGGTSSEPMSGNLSIAYGVIIENAIGGSGDDIFVGNAASNILSGGLGNDLFYGSTGSDTIYGEGGSDVVDYEYELFEFAGTVINADTIVLSHGIEVFTDTIIGVEFFDFADITYSFSQVFDFFNLVIGNNLITGTDLSETLSGTAQVDEIYGLAGDDTLVGRAGADLLFGDDGDDILKGDAGNDTLNGGLGEDDLRGHDGDDVLLGDEDDDLLSGGDGADVLHGGHGNDALFGGQGVDTLYGDAGDDVIYGQEGDDIIRGGLGNDELYGGYLYSDSFKSDDQVFGEEGDDTLWGRDGDDMLDGGDGVDTIYGGDDNDMIFGGMEGDFIRGDRGNDEIWGGAGNDTISGNRGNDIIHGGEGDDLSLAGSEGNDEVYGDAGNDIVKGEGGNDFVSGGDGDDDVRGHGGKDILLGDAGNDTLTGGDDTDILIGGAGADILYGQDGWDQFIFDVTSFDGSIDVIMDFSTALFEKVVISEEALVGYNALTSAISDFVTFTNVGNNSSVSVDRDGQGTEYMFEQIAALQNVDDLSYGNNIRVESEL